MPPRTPVKHHYYGVIAAVWYATVVVGGGLAGLLVWRLHTETTTLLLVVEILGAILLVLGALAPATVGLALRRRQDPATAMTVSALIMLGHVLILSGPLFLATPFVSRYLAIKRHDSGGY